MRRLNWALFVILFSIFCLIPFILYSVNCIIDPFLLHHISNLILVKNINNINFADASFPYVSGFATMMLIFSKIAGISLQKLQFYIIVGPILLLCYYVLSKQVTKSNTYSLLLMSIVAFGFAVPYYSVWPHGWGFTLYLVFIYLYSKLLSENNKISKINIVILLLIIFIAANFYSYTAEVWMISFSILVNIFVLYYAYKHNNQLNIYSTRNILIVFIAIFLEFNNIAFNTYLPKIEIDAVYDSLKLFLNPLSIFFSNPITEPNKYLYHSESPKLLVLINTINLVLLILPVLLSIFFDFKFLLKKEYDINSIKYYIFKYSAAIVNIVDVLIYSLLGILFLRYVQFLFPILSASSLDQLNIKNRRKVVSLFLCCILILSAISFFWNLSTGTKITSKLRYEESNYGINWTYVNGLNVTVLSDHYTTSLYEIAFAEKGSRLNGGYYSNESFYHLVDPDYIRNYDGYFKNHYVIINQNFRTHKTWTGGWIDFKPMILYEHNIENNVNLNKIYNDNNLLILIGK